MKIASLLFLSAALFSFLPAPPACAVDNLVIDPAPGPAQLTLQGPAAAVGNSGFLIQHIDDDGTTFDLTEPVSFGKFVLRRPIGFYQWNFSNADTSERPAMELSNNHSLVLRSNLASDRDAEPELNAIELRPGANGGVFFNGLPLASPFNPGLTFAGGSTVKPAGVAIGGGWPAEFTSDGLLAAGAAVPNQASALAFGAGSVALGRSARASFVDSFAFGRQAVAEWSGMSFGSDSFASGGIAIGNAAHAEYMACAMGTHAWSGGHYSTTVGASAYAGAEFSIGVSGWANAPTSLAGAWGTTWGEASIALGGYAGAYKSFAASSGVTYGDYSVAIGRGTVTWQHYTTALGTFNAYTNPASITPNATDPLFVIGNGWVENDNTPQYAEHRSNAFIVGHDGAAWVQGGLTVDGTAMSKDANGDPALQPAPSLFKGDVAVQGGLSVQGVLRVPESGDLSMGGFKAGTPP
jgi:hypothetical protein